MKATATRPPVDCERLLPGHDFADAFTMEVPEGSDARQLAALAFAQGPRWAKTLLALRNRIVGVMGLKGASTGGFPVIRESADDVLMGFDDRHLDFRIAVTVRGRQATITTVVRTHNLGGRTYLRVVMPFHRRIAPSMLEHGVAAAARA
jgi:hypothetical protein